LAMHLAKIVWHTTAFRFNYKMKRKSQTAETTMTYKFYCAQLHGEQTKKKLAETGK
ncbi:hypothetical protein L208DRAFT_1343314, partial [Tricholoma matsutake]